MNEIVNPPTERDLPPEAVTRIRTNVLRVVDRPLAPGATRRARMRVAVVAAILLAIGSGAVAGVTSRNAPANHDVRLLAMGPGELSPRLRDATEDCLGWIRRPGPDPAGGEQPVPVSLADLAVAMERGDRTVVLFLNDVGYATCDRKTAKGQEPSGGIASDHWPKDDWLPGPVQRLLLTSTEADGGEVSVSGRVSRRVKRLVLDHGDGRETTARLSGGAFGLITTDAGLRSDNDPELVSYDKGGAEIDRRLLFQAADQLERCYSAPSGTVVHGRARTGCLTAERWDP